MSKAVIDLRSDTVTLPTEAMREAMLAAPLGDDVYGEDPTVNALEAQAAELSGKQAALFVCSGTQSNLLAVLSHCQRGDEYIAGQDAHIYRYEAGGAAVLGSVQPQPLPFDERARLPMDQLPHALKEDDFHFASTRLICLENTHHGVVCPQSHVLEVAQFAKAHGLQFHLDGARIFNAAVATNTSLKTLAEPFDSVSICLSKGLSAPVGSVLCGSVDLIERARRTRKMLGGGMRQAGLLAAAAQLALSEQSSKLQNDHDNAKALAEAIGELPGVTMPTPETNMVWLRLDAPVGAAASDFAKQRGVLFGGGADRIRLVTHRNFSAEQIEPAAQVIRDFFNQVA